MSHTGEWEGVGTEGEGPGGSPASPDVFARRHSGDDNDNDDERSGHSSTSPAGFRVVRADDPTSTCVCRGRPCRAIVRGCGSADWFWVH
ncbi:uncharacterized protein LOC100818815 [Anopheles sinensis]|uniref:Uncharacterized protein LOC100818815 n=1 Tax=Anopheles sinensis TaxID=74873 RepID=A0A084VQ19_ANOSI|nr:uncharacterized protein LOC100818815 [Anopheles sinensis]